MRSKFLLTLALSVWTAAASAQSASPADADLSPSPAAQVPAAQSPATAPPAAPVPVPADTKTYAQEDVINAAEGAFGKGAEGLAGLLEKILKENGRPNAYIEGREVGGAVIVGLRNGSGQLHHKVEGDMPVYWTGPSVGFDIGGDGSKTFALVYNLDDSADLFRRFPAVEGKVYVVGGFTANYLQRGRTIIVPIKLGVGWRVGANLGYLKFSKTSKLMPF